MSEISDVPRFELVTKRKTTTSTRKALGSLPVTKHSRIDAILIVRIGNVPILTRGSCFGSMIRMSLFLGNPDFHQSSTGSPMR